MEDSNVWVDLVSEPTLNPGGGPKATPPLPIRPPSPPKQILLKETHLASPQTTLGDPVCDDCELQKDQLSLCDICNKVYCEECWKYPLTHRKQMPGDLPHEKTDVELGRKIQACIAPGFGEAELEMLHTRDQQTLWFDCDNDARFFENDRFDELIFHYPTDRRSKLCPGIVSFMGQTGAGKSSLINLLISLRSDQKRNFDRPIVGSHDQEHSATSSGIHLYQDPLSTESDNPMFYADCEGLQAGNTVPVSAKYSSLKHMNKTFKLFMSKAKRIWWASAGEETSSREYIVTNLYSKLLYTFSDVVVFVLSNPRTVEGVLEQLLSWGASSVEHSSNQPALPRVIIAINKAPENIPEDQWKSEGATKWLFSSVDESLPTNTKFRPYMPQSTIGQRVTMKMLLHQYYSSVSVVKIPYSRRQGGRYNEMQRQIHRLYDEIKNGCLDSRKDKDRLRVLLTADQIPPYIRLAYNHFLLHKDVPFDFIQASFKFHPVADDFAAHLFELARRLLGRCESFACKETYLVEEFSAAVAACIMLDTVRNKRSGDSQTILSSYGSFCSEALQSVFRSCWPCKYPGCVNFESGHTKGHQDKTGKVLDAGEHNQNFIPIVGFEDVHARFMSRVGKAFESLLDRLPNRSDGVAAYETAARNMHRESMRNFYVRNGGSSTYISHRTCFSCLTSIAEHPIRCGHVLCTKCIQEGSLTLSNRSVIQVKECPLHGERIPQQTVILKPEQAGIRILALDGGGVRSIIQLTILKRLEKSLGMDIALSAFFDLVVGTSAGAIVAAGIFIKGWTPSETTKTFSTVCKDAFQMTTLGSLSEWKLPWNLPMGFGRQPLRFLRLLRQLRVTLFSSYVLESKLKENLGTEKLFGTYRDSQQSYSTRVAFTATSASRKSVLLGNYNRASRSEDKYDFLRASDVETEIELWEAIRASTAAPTWFTSYHHESTGFSLLDGGINHNNPADIAYSEAVRLWPHNAIDLLLSIGTGRIPDDIDSSSGEDFTDDPIAILLHKAYNSLDANVAWDKFEVAHQKDLTRKLYRFNVDLDAPLPELHEVAQLESLMERAEDWCSQPEVTLLFEHVKRCLIASSFYYEVDGEPVPLGDQLKCNGSIGCRFGDSFHAQEFTSLLRQMHQIAKGRTNQAGLRYPLFRFAKTRNAAIQFLELDGTREQDAEMRTWYGQEFNLTLDDRGAQYTIELCLADDDSWPISGFPRTFSTEQ